MIEQPDPDQLNEMLERYRQVMEACRKAMLELGKYLAEALRPIIEAVVEWYVSLQREALYDRLRRWRFPHWLARFLADRWPRRWLSGLESVD